MHTLFIFHGKVIASVQTLGRRGSGAARLRKFANYGGVVVVDEVSQVNVVTITGVVLHNTICFFDSARLLHS